MVCTTEASAVAAADRAVAAADRLNAQPWCELFSDLMDRFEACFSRPGPAPAPAPTPDLVAGLPTPSPTGNCRTNAEHTG